MVKVPHLYGFCPVWTVFSAVDHDLPDQDLAVITRNNLHALIIHDSVGPAVNMRQCTDPALDNKEKFKCLDCEVYGIESLLCIGLCKINNNNLTALFIDNNRQYRQQLTRVNGNLLFWLPMECFKTLYIMSLMTNLPTVQMHV